MPYSKGIDVNPHGILEQGQVEEYAVIDVMTMLLNVDVPPSIVLKLAIDIGAHNQRMLYDQPAKVPHV